MVRWLVALVGQEPQPFFPVTAARLAASEAGVPPGWYTFAVAQQEFTGLRRANTLLYRAAPISGTAVLTQEESERVVSIVMQRGRDAPNVSSRAPLDRVRAVAERCEAACHTDYEQERERFVADNESRCNAQEASIQRWHERRLADPPRGRAGRSAPS